MIYLTLTGICILLLYLLRYIYRKYRLINQQHINESTTILITGGCLGIGKELIKIFLKKFKCKIINLDIRENEFKKLEEISKELGGTIQNILCDISNYDELNLTIKNIKSIHILINNAGIAFNKPLSQSEDIELLKTIQVNLISPVLLTKKALNELNAKHIVTIASVMSHLPSPNSCDYVSSKWGVYGFHESIRQEYRSKNFTIVCPYAVNTGMFPNFTSPFPL